MAMALFPFRNPITEATGCLGGIAAHVHLVRQQVPFDNLAFLLLRQRVEDRSQLLARFAEDYLPSSFRHKYHRILAVPLGVG